MLTSVIYNKVDRYVSTIDTPDLFIYKPIYSKPQEEKIIMKIKVVLVDILVHMNQGKYGTNVFHEKVKKMLYIDILKAIYGMLQSALL